MHGANRNPAQLHQPEDVIRKAGRVGVMLLDSQVRLVVEQPFEPVGRVPHPDVDHLGAGGRVLVGDVGVEEAPRRMAARCRQVAASWRGGSHALMRESSTPATVANLNPFRSRGTA